MQATFARVREGQFISTKWAAAISAAGTLFVTLRVILSLFPLLVAPLFPLEAPCTAAAPTPDLHSGGIAFPLLGVW